MPTYYNHRDRGVTR